MLRLGIAGCGYWGTNIIRTLKEIDDAKVVAVADPDREARRRTVSLLDGDVKTHSSFDRLLSDSVDGVVVASPPHVHVEQAVLALSREKAVFLEKPPAMNLPDMNRLLDAAQGKTLLCDYVFCYNPLVQFVKGFMKEIGFRLITADLRWTNWGIVRTGVDCWWSGGPHPVSVLSCLFGRMKRSWLLRGQGWARAHFAFLDEISSAGVFVSWSHPIKRREIELVGAKRSILIDDVARKLWIINHDDLKGRFSVPKIEYKPLPLKAALTDFVHCAKTGNEPVCGVGMIEKVTRLMV